MINFKRFIRETSMRTAEIDPADIFLYQVGEHDQSHINGLASKFKSGEQIDEIEVAPITDKMKKDVSKKLEELEASDDRAEVKMFRELVKTDKHYIVIDGHHRVLAAVQAGISLIKANIDKNFPASELGLDYL